MAQRNAPGCATPEQLRAAEVGLSRLLIAKGFAWEWIERNRRRLLDAALCDLAARVAAGCRDEKTGLLVVLAYSRALGGRGSEDSGPLSFCLDDRLARLLTSLRELPERECRLLSLTSFGGLGIKKAGAELGWSPAEATRRHKKALELLQELFGERLLLSQELAVAAAVASDYTLPKGHLAGGLAVAIKSVRRAASKALHLGSRSRLSGPRLGLPRGGR